MSGSPDEIDLIKQRKLAEMRRRAVEEEQAERMRQEAEPRRRIYSGQY